MTQPHDRSGRDAAGWARVEATLADTRTDQVAHLCAALERDPNLPQYWLALRWAAELLAALAHAANALPGAVPPQADPAALQEQVWAWEGWLRQRHWGSWPDELAAGGRGGPSALHGPATCGPSPNAGGTAETVTRDLAAAPHAGGGHARHPPRMAAGQVLAAFQPGAPAGGSGAGAPGSARAGTG